MAVGFSDDQLMVGCLTGPTACHTQRFIRETSALKSNPLMPLYVPFLIEKIPFLKPSIDKWYPFHILGLELCIPFNDCKCTV